MSRYCLYHFLTLSGAEDSTLGRKAARNCQSCLRFSVKGYILSLELRNISLQAAAYTMASYAPATAKQRAKSGAAKVMRRMVEWRARP